MAKSSYSDVMRRSIHELRSFYGDPRGDWVRRLLARRLADAWGTAYGCDVLGLGYATPWLDQFSDARRAIAAMPARQGAEHWASGSRNRTALVDENALPFSGGQFDRVLIVHAIEEADDPQHLLVEAARTMSANGRMIIATAARGGLWARAETTPFGHGRPFSRPQLEKLVRGTGLEPTAWSPALYVPPWRPLLAFSEGFEQAGRLLMPGTAGLILMEAARHTYARPRGKGAMATIAARPALAGNVTPAPTRTSTTNGLPRVTPKSGDSTEGDLAPCNKPIYGGVPCTD